MTTLTAERIDGAPAGYRVSCNGEMIATLKFAAWRRRATVELADGELRFRRKAWWGAFVGEGYGRVALHAAKTGTSPGGFVVESAGGFCSLARGRFRTSYKILRAGEELGSIRRSSMFGAGATAELPESFSTAEQLFMLWLVLSQWESESAVSFVPPG